MLAQMCSPALHAPPDSSFPAASGSAEWHIWASSSCNFTISSPIHTILDVLVYIPIEPRDHITVVLISICIIAVILARVKLLLVWLQRVDDAVVQLAISPLVVVTLPARVLAQQKMDLGGSISRIRPGVVLDEHTIVATYATNSTLTVVSP